MRKDEKASVEGLLANTVLGGKDGDCRLWTKGVFADGYAQVWYEGRSFRASRLMHLLAHGSQVEGDVWTCEYEEVAEELF